MKTLREFITELFDNPYAHRRLTHPTQHIYAFNGKSGKKYRVFIDHMMTHDGSKYVHHGHVTFDGGGSMGMTNDSRDDSHRVMSTVSHILKKHAESHPNLSSYHFTGEDRGRVKLYDVLARKHGGTSEEDEDGVDRKKYVVPIKR